MKRIALFAHYDGKAEVKRYIVHHLRELRKVCDAVWFVSSGGVSEAELSKARDVCERAWTRPNVGYDFGMWHEALRDIDCTAWDELILTNSSVFGPLWPLEEAFAKMANVSCDFWGMTDSGSISWHVQSYFLVVRRGLLHSAAFKEFFSSIQPLTDKRDVIRRYEVGFTTRMTQAGYRGAVFAPRAEIPRALIKRLLRPNFNPPISQPLALLSRRMPYVKVELLRDNPRKIPLHRVFAVMDGAGYDRSLIEIDPRPRAP
jgi:rhamnosyltransferase